MQTEGQEIKESEPPKLEREQADAIRKKTFIMKIVISCLALGCMIVVILVLAKSSKFFSYMFSLDTELVIKAYLKKNFTNMMALLYLSIFGFVITISDTILLFFKFTQKQKLLWFHLAFSIAFLICGCVTLSSKSYDDYMKGLEGRSLTDPLCVAAAFTLECLLTTEYFSYRTSVVIFFIVFTILFVVFTGLYHYTAVKLMPFETEVKKPEGAKESIFNANVNNETFVSEMLDEYA